ncbi:inactive hydroxysteroid dehydrogenase-like protein 1 [Sphaeramia orbicularis]|uniref:inactive hydroxysteroid dehydrogenase-like protein 1 n=1 Tax=Sphaeramia orbicularis TaxID=375764 RepID=UPI00117E373D|nr:inactive hydroxysteroid dehydrogenase-like protein 1 [Sphaeramia orbicularis]
MAAVDSFQFLYREIARSCSFYFETLALVGALYTASKAVILLRDCCTLVRVHFLPRMIPSRRLTHRFGDWAVIYDAAEPLAKAYAEELARQGVSLIFVTQDHTAVRDSASSLSQTYGVEAVVVLADFCLDQSASKPIKDAMRGKDVGFLVNCLDQALASPRSLTDMPEQALMDLLNKNVAVATLMARLVLPGMVERRRGAVINISSGACSRPLPGRVTLTASTGYLDHFSRALHLEYSRSGIFVQSLIPFQIASDERQPSSSSSSSSCREGWFVPKPEVYARHAISTLGVSNRTTGYWPHTLQYGLMRCIPEWIWVLGSRVLISSS